LHRLRQEDSSVASDRPRHRRGEELEQPPGVDRAAGAIVEFRTKTGRFQCVTDLLVIRGVSESKLKKMRPYIWGQPAAQEIAASRESRSYPLTHIHHRFI
jgi:Helix-hairpin-helix motif